jgi:hypothetical protein
MTGTGRLAMGVFFCAAAFFLLLASGRIYATNEETLYQMIQGIADHGSPRVAPTVWGIAAASVDARPGPVATRYAPGQPILALPLFWPGRAVGQVAGGAYAVFLSRFIVLTFNAFATAATAAVLFAFAHALGYRIRVSAALALCYSIGTYALIQARTFFAEPLTALLVLLAFFLLRQGGNEGRAVRRRMWLIGAGLAIGAALLVKIQATLFVPILALYFLMMCVPSRVMRRAGSGGA